MPDNAPVFVDTNVLVYSRDASAAEKQRRAREWLEALWRSRRGRLSRQVLHEYYVTVTQKLSPGMPRVEARADVRAFETWQPLASDLALLERAWSLQDSYAISFWDSLVVAAAMAAGCSHLLSEDLQAGQRFGELEVTDPFTTAPAELLQSQDTREPTDLGRQEQQERIE